MSLRSNLYFLAICAILLCAANGAPAASYTGLLQVIKKSVFAKDMIHIVKTIFQNAKFADYPDIKEEIGSGLFKKGLYITDIDISSIEFDPALLIASVAFNSANKKVTLYSGAPLLKYNFVFSWRAEAFGIHLAFGTANATMTSTSIDAKYSILAEPSSLAASFNVAITEVKGSTELIPNIKDWLLAKLKTSTYSALLQGISHNVRFLDEHTHVAMRKLTKRLTETHVLDYIAKPVNADEEGEYLLYDFDMHLLIDEKEFANVTKKHDLPIETMAHDIALYISPVIAPLTMRAHGFVGRCDGEFDLKTIGLTGTTKDLFTPLPALTSTYTGSEPLKMFCEYAHEGVTILAKKVIILPAHCTFSLADKGTVLLNTRVEFKMNYEAAVTKDRNQLFAAKLSNVTPQNFSSSPRSPDVNLFLMRVYLDMAKVRFEGQLASAPMIRYEPYRGYSNFVAEVKEESYVAYYNDTTA